MRPLNWRRSEKGDPNISDDGVKYCNGILFHKGDKVIECKLDVHHLNDIELFDLQRGHPAWSSGKSQRGVKAIHVIPADVIVGFYAGIYRPGSFAPENPYVFDLQPSNLDLVIDALLVGNITRYINDPKGTGKEANLEAEDVVIQNGTHTIRCVQFRSLREIQIGEELLVEYEASTRGYWDHFAPEMIDLTSDPHDIHVVKRQVIRSKSPKKSKKKVVPLKKRERKDLSVVTRSARVKSNSRILKSPLKKSKNSRKSVSDEPKTSSEEQEVAEEVYDNEIKKPRGVSAEEIASLLSEAEKEFEAIRNLQVGENDLQDMIWESAPNVNELIASASLGNLECLAASDSSTLNSLDGRTSLNMWWRTAKRSCVIYGVFQLLRQRKAKNSKIEDRYDALQGEGVLSFGQASRYARIGKFLSDYPMFVFQRKWVTQADWFQTVDINPKTNRGTVKLVDYLPSLLSVSSAFVRNSFTLHEQGFMAIPDLMKEYVSEELIEACTTGCKEFGEIVFNNAKIDSRQNDKKRVQISLDKIVEAAGFFEALVVKLSQLYPAHKVDSMIAMLSKAGCKSQLAHTDYTPGTLAIVGNDDSKVPLACLVALKDGTLFDVWPGAIRFNKERTFKPLQVMLHVGDALIFRGDLIHNHVKSTTEDLVIETHMSC